MLWECIFYSEGFRGSGISSFLVYFLQEKYDISLNIGKKKRISRVEESLFFQYIDDIHRESVYASSWYIVYVATEPIAIHTSSCLGTAEYDSDTSISEHIRDYVRCDRIRKKRSFFL